jgi:hypothetical protein
VFVCPPPLVRVKQTTCDNLRPVFFGGSKYKVLAYTGRVLGACVAAVWD